MVRITRDVISKYATNPKTGICNINASQCRILGFEFNQLRPGWIDKLDGVYIPKDKYELFKKLHGVAGKNNQKRIIEQGSGLL